MDVAMVKALSQAVSSEDLQTARNAKRQLSEILSPQCLVGMWSDGATANLFEGLLRDVAEVQNEDIYSIVASALAQVFRDEPLGKVLLSKDLSLLIPRFLFSALALQEEELSLAMCMRPAAVSLISLVLRIDSADDVAVRIGVMCDELLRGDTVLRLFNCDAVEAIENGLVVEFLHKYTNLISVIWSTTVNAFDVDPLALANYLVVCGIVSRREPIPVSLSSRVEAALRECDADELVFAFCCRFCSISLLQHDSNASQHAPVWVALAVDFLDKGSEDAVDAIFDLIGSACTTEDGWTIVSTSLAPDALGRRLRSSSDVLRLSALGLLVVMLSSQYVDGQFLTRDLFHDVWQLKSSVSGEVRVAVWQVVCAMVRSVVLRSAVAPACASFLCGSPQEETASVRQLQLETAHCLMSCGELPESTTISLGEFMQNGLYPKGSAGVAELTRD